MRSAAREAVFKFIFARSFNDDAGEKFFERLLISPDITDADKEFAEKLAKIIEERHDELIGIISRLSKEYSYGRIFSMDKCCLLIGLAELIYFDDVPDAVAVDEAVKLAARYSTEGSPSFVNGILAAYIKENKA